MTNELTKQQVKEKISNYIAEVERLTEKRKNINEEIKETFEGAKREGFDVKAIKEILKIRKKDMQEAINEEETREFYVDLLIFNEE